MNAVTFYVCDPKKATFCKKTTCALNGGDCRLTTHSYWAKEDKNGNLVRARTNKERARK